MSITHHNHLGMHHASRTAPTAGRISAVSPKPPDSARIVRNNFTETRWSERTTTLEPDPSRRPHHSRIYRQSQDSNGLMESTTSCWSPRTHHCGRGFTFSENLQLFVIHLWCASVRYSTCIRKVEGSTTPKTFRERVQPLVIVTAMGTNHGFWEQHTI